MVRLGWVGSVSADNQLLWPEAIISVHSLPIPSMIAPRGTARRARPRDGCARGREAHRDGHRRMRLGAAGDVGARWVNPFRPWSAGALDLCPAGRRDTPVGRANLWWGLRI